MSYVNWGFVERVYVHLKSDLGWKIEEPYRVAHVTRHRNGEVSVRLAGEGISYTYSGSNTSIMPEFLQAALESLRR